MGDRASLDAETEYVKDLPGFDKTTPQFFSDPMIDKLLEITLLLGGEVWANRDRQMIMEHLLATEGVVTPDLIETFRPDESFKEMAEERRVKFIQRIFGCLYDDADLSAEKNTFERWTRKQDKDEAA